MQTIFRTFCAALSIGYAQTSEAFGQEGLTSRVVRAAENLVDSEKPVVSKVGKAVNLAKTAADGKAAIDAMQNYADIGMDKRFSSQRSHPKPQSRNGVATSASIGTDGVVPVDFLIFSGRTTR